MAAGSPTPKRPPTLSRDRIIDAARSAIEDAGYEALSLRGLARRLGVTAPALYDHFESKAEVLRAVAELGYSRLEEMFAQTQSERAIDRVRDRSHAYVCFAREHPELFRVMFLYRPAAVLLENDNELAAATKAFEHGSLDINQAVADGDLVQRDDVVLTLTLWAGVHGVACVALMAPQLSELVADDVIEALFNGLRPESSIT